VLTFDQAAHQYFWNGARVPNVTSILAPLTDYSRIPPDVLERARQQGIAIHRMVELDCKNDLDSVPEWMKGHHEAWCKFKDDTGFECWFSESKVYHEKMGYAGTPDLGGLLTKLKTTKPKLSAPALIDVKRSFYAGPVIGLQLAAYEMARNSTVLKDLRTELRFALRLDADGKYRLEPFVDRNDFAVFTAQLATYRWKEKYGRPQ